jgi:hypothetical protein
MRFHFALWWAIRSAGVIFVKSILPQEVVVRLRPRRDGRLAAEHQHAVRRVVLAHEHLEDARPAPVNPLNLPPLLP